MDYTLEQINSAFDALPTELVQALIGIDFDSNLIKISQKYNLNGELNDILKFDVLMIIVKLSDKNTLLQILPRELSITPDISNEIMNDLDILIFKPIDEYIKKSDERRDFFNQTENLTQGITRIGEEEQVPIPPYAKVETKPIEQPKITETINLPEIKPAEIYPPRIPTYTNIQTPTPVQAPTPTQTPAVARIPNILEDKLTHATVNTETVSDYSNPKADPYREEF
jgi:hypothetical protein